jgi:hypothetical protein
MRSRLRERKEEDCSAAVTIAIVIEYELGILHRWVVVYADIPSFVLLEKRTHMSRVSHRIAKPHQCVTKFILTLSLSASAPEGILLSMKP